MLNVTVHAKHDLLQESLEQLVISLGHRVSPVEEADAALWELCSVAPAFPPPPPVPTLAIIHPADRHALEVLRLGYRGYIYGENSRDQLKSALGVIVRGELWAERYILSKAFELRPAPTFTPREREVLSLVTQGLSNKEIAQDLDLTENTVKGYVSKLLDKLEVKNRARIILSQQEAA